MNTNAQKKKAFTDVIDAIMRDSAAKGVNLENDEIIKIAINQEAPSYFISLERAERLLNDYLVNGRFTTVVNDHKRNLLLSLLGRLMTCDGIRNGTVYRPRLSYVLTNYKAPSFYITESYARKLFYDKSIG